MLRRIDRLKIYNLYAAVPCSISCVQQTFLFIYHSQYIRTIYSSVLKVQGIHHSIYLLIPHEKKTILTEICINYLSV